MSSQYKTTKSDINKQNTTLATTPPGTTVTVEALKDSTPPSLFRKLCTMGVLPGNVITVIGRAPFGDPISISTLGYVLSLRLAEAQEVLIAQTA